MAYVNGVGFGNFIWWKFPPFSPGSDQLLGCVTANGLITGSNRFRQAHPTEMSASSPREDDYALGRVTLPAVITDPDGFQQPGPREMSAFLPRIDQVPSCTTLPAVNTGSNRFLQPLLGRPSLASLPGE